jgi:hypothetical protein
LLLESNKFSLKFTDSKRRANRVMRRCAKTLVWNKRTRTKKMAEEDCVCPSCYNPLPKELFGKTKTQDDIIAQRKARSSARKPKEEPEVNIELTERQIKNLREKAASLVLRGKAQAKWAAPLAETLGARTAPALGELLRISVGGIVIPGSIVKRFWNVFFFRSKQDKQKRSKEQKRGEKRKR